MRHFLLLSNYKQDFQQSFSICLYIMEYNTQWKIIYTYQWHYFHNNQLFSSEKKSSCLFTINIQLFVDFFFVTDGTTIPFKESLNGALPSRKCSNDLIPHSQQYSVPENISRVLQQIALSTSTWIVEYYQYRKRKPRSLRP